MDKDFQSAIKARVTKARAPGVDEQETLFRIHADLATAGFQGDIAAVLAGMTLLRNCVQIESLSDAAHLKRFDARSASETANGAGKIPSLAQRYRVNHTW